MRNLAPAFILGSLWLTACGVQETENADLETRSSNDTIDPGVVTDDPPVAASDWVAGDVTAANGVVDLASGAASAAPPGPTPVQAPAPADQSAPNSVEEGQRLAAPSPTTGWKQSSFKFVVHHPWNLPVGDRFKFDGASNTYDLFVLKGDQPFAKNSPTSPRTEMRWGNDYNAGSHMFDADVRIARGTAGTCIMQIFRGVKKSGPATAIMLAVQKDGSLRRYFNPNGPLIKSDVYDKWWNLKVAHDSKTGQIQVFADDKLVLTSHDQGAATHYFKNGTYGTNGRSEVQFRNIRYWVK